MMWVLYHENEVISEFGTNHSISLDDAIELCGMETAPEDEEYDYTYEGKEIWYDCLKLELKKSIITEIRTLAGLSRAEMSRKYNIPVRTLENWEAGVNEAPDYTIDLLARVALEDSGKYEEIKFFVVETKDNVGDEWDCLSTTKITEAIKGAQREWDSLSKYDQKHSDFEIRLYALSEESREDSDNWDCDLIEWR